MLTFEDRRRWTKLVLRMPSTELSAANKTVLLALESYADYRDGTGAHPGEQNLSEAAGVDVRTVRRALAAGRNLGLILQTAAANPKAGKAAEYSITLPGPNGISTGQPSPVNNSTTGHSSPVNNSTTGHGSPVETVHHRTGMSFQQDTGVLPPKPYTNNQGGLRNSGTSPAPVELPQTPQAPSRYCERHPQGTPGGCWGCKRANDAFKAWQAEQAVIDVAIADAARREHEQLRLGCPRCGGTSWITDDQGEPIEKCDHKTPPRGRRGLSLVPPLPDTLENVRAAQ
ncbi:hypothetical protein A5721_16350 [Mycobacterium vulneris]|nr:hypothetical protein A5721_16350 [Mycolicibacterium vulneris]